MRKTKFFIVSLLLLFIITPVWADEINLKSNNAILYNLKDDQIVYEKNKDQKVSIASLTKLMTALVALENINDLKEKVTFDKSDYQKLIEQNAASSSLDRNKQYTYEELLYGLILESGADCANALARLTAGNEEEFVKKMNEKAKELGMKNTSFANPIGLDDKNNYSTMSDMLILLKHDFEDPVIGQIMTTLKYKLSDNTKIEHTIYSYMKTYEIKIPTMLGGKTGYEDDAGYALASVAKNDNIYLMLVTSKADEAPDHITDAKRVYDYYFKNYGYNTIVKKGTTIATLNTKYLSKNKINIKVDKDITYYINNSFKEEDIKLKYEGIKTLTLKNKYKEKLGTLKIYYKDKLVKKYPIKLNERIYPNYKIILVACLTYTFIVVSTVITIKKLKKRV